MKECVTKYNKMTLSCVNIHVGGKSYTLPTQTIVVSSINYFDKFNNHHTVSLTVTDVESTQALIKTFTLLEVT